MKTEKADDKILKMIKEKKIYKKWWFWLIVICLLSFIVWAMGKEEKDYYSTPAHATNAKPQTLNAKIKSGINKKIVKLEINDNMGSTAANDKIILLTLDGDNNSKTSLLYQTNDVFQSIFKNKEVSDAVVFWQATLVDSYGKESKANVLKIELTRKTYSKINWDNFDYNNYKTIADSYYMHPALK